ncbi:MAG: MipA/OmpV family protein [Beijerinckiaceae bacterium]
MRNNSFVFVLPLATVLAFAGAARAEPLWSPLSGEWLVTVKGNLTGSPAYPGARDLAFFPYPSLSVRRAGTPLAFSSPDDNLGFAVIDNGWFKFGPSAKFVGARRAADHSELVGLRDVDWTLEAGAFAELWAHENLRFRLDTRYGFHGHKGMVADVGADYVHRTGKWTLSAGPRLALGSVRYMRSYFGVTPAEAVLNPKLTPWRPGGGIASVGVAAAASYDFTDRWRGTLWGRYDRLAGQAGSSPIPTNIGSRNQFTLGATLAYSFSLRIP